MTAQLKPVVTRKNQEDKQTAQSGGAVRISGVSRQHTPATKLWFGKVSNEPGFRSLPHHHGEAETGGYVLQGRGRIYYGEGYSEWVDMRKVTSCLSRLSGVRRPGLPRRWRCCRSRGLTRRGSAHRPRSRFRIHGCYG